MFKNVIVSLRLRSGMHKSKFTVLLTLVEIKLSYNGELQQSDCFSFIAQLRIPVELTTVELRAHKRQSDNRISEYVLVFINLSVPIASLEGYQ